MTGWRGEWRYLPTGEVSHLVESGNSGAACGMWTLPASDWRGSGAQSEYEEVERRPKCKNCLKRSGAA